MNKTITGMYSHEQLNEDMEWSGQLLSYRKLMGTMKTYLETVLVGAPAPGVPEKARCMLVQLAHHQYHLDEIAHIARMNEYALLARMNGDTATIEHHRNASRIKEQSLLQFFGKGFLRFNDAYVALCNDAATDTRRCG